MAPLRRVSTCPSQRAAADNDCACVSIDRALGLVRSCVERQQRLTAMRVGNRHDLASSHSSFCGAIVSGCMSLARRHRSATARLERLNRRGYLRVNCSRLPSSATMLANIPEKPNTFSAPHKQIILVVQESRRHRQVGPIEPDPACRGVMDPSVSHELTSAAPRERLDFAAPPR